jgi:hypothetical protein
MKKGYVELLPKFATPWVAYVNDPFRKKKKGKKKGKKK